MITFGMMNAEFMPAWFDGDGSERRIWPKKGFAGNLLLLLWAVMGMLISMFFLSMLRTNMLKVVLEEPIDTTEQLVKSGKTIYLGRSGWHLSYHQTSDNIWYKKVGEMAQLYSDAPEVAPKMDRRIGE